MSHSEPALRVAREIEAARLAEAFRVFNQASVELTEAYAGLRAQVATLSAELAAANAEVRRQNEARAALSERLAMLLDALPAGVLVIDARGRVALANPAAESLLGAGVAGAPWEALLAARLQATETPGELLHGEAGRVAISSTDLAASGERIVLLHDISQTHALKAQAERNQRLAAMGEMAAALAHQLRTPLAAALLYAGGLENASIGAAERAQCSAGLLGRLRHLERVVGDMLSFTRGQSGGQERFYAADLGHEAAEGCAPVAAARHVSLDLRCDCPRAALTGNRKAIAGALTNLLENAVQASAAGGQTVVFDVTERTDRVEFAVRDDGHGIEAALQTRLFEPFFTTRADGTGLGLAIARGVARAHGGDIRLDATSGRGSTFVLWLPSTSSPGSP
jgi:two-component system sensor histidine kinase FlrB